MWAAQCSRDVEKGTDPNMPAIPNVITFQLLSRLSLGFPCHQGSSRGEVVEPISRVLAKLQVFDRYRAVVWQLVACTLTEKRSNLPYLSR